MSDFEHYENIKYSLGHGIRPSLTHTTGFGGLQASPSTTASHAVRDTMRHLV
jgi:hypothetical protein